MKRIFGICLILVVIIIMTGCDSMAKGDKNYAEHTGYLFEKIEETECLYYDVNTKIVYIIFNERASAGYQGYGYMSVYYAGNGLPYKYIDGELKEIE